MSWLCIHYVVLNCNVKFVTPKILRRRKLEWEGWYKPNQVKIMSAIHACKLVEQSCLSYLSHDRDVEVETLSVGSIQVVV